MEIIRGELVASQVTPANTRYNSDCNCIQTTPDGGTTWNDGAPESDPRFGAAFRRPARTSSDPRCDAAANMTATLKKNLDDIFLATNVASIGSDMLVGLALLTIATGFLADLAIIIAGGIISLGLAAIEAAFTPGVYDQLESILYCNIGTDGSVSAAQLATIESDVSSVIGGIVSDTFNLYMSLWGEVGLSNAGATGTAVGSCGSFFCCPPGLDWCHTLIDVTTNNDGGFVTVPIGDGFTGNPAIFGFDAGVSKWGWQQDTDQRSAGVEQVRVLRITQTLPSGHYTYVSMDWSAQFGSFTTDIRSFVATMDGSTFLSQTSDGTGTAIWTGDVTGTPVLEVLALVSYRNDHIDGGGGARIFETVVGGLGANPF